MHTHAIGYGALTYLLTSLTKPLKYISLDNTICTHTQSGMAHSLTCFINKGSSTYLLTTHHTLTRKWVWCTHLLAYLLHSQSHSSRYLLITQHAHTQSGMAHSLTCFINKGTQLHISVQDVCEGHGVLRLATCKPRHMLGPSG